MNRSFWMAVGAIGGIAAYRKSLQVAARAKELGPLGSAQAIAAGTSRAAGRTANGLGRLSDAKERRAGRLLTGSATDRTGLPGSVPATPSAIPDGWSAVPGNLSGVPAAGQNSAGTNKATVTNHDQDGNR
jgi:hypothetical protein